MKPPSRLSSVILWSIISAAFIGPGTVTTAISSGAGYGLTLLWAVVFATLACIVLQELSARITIATGITFGESLLRIFGERKGAVLQWIVGGSVILGCAAYEAGNLLGAVAGLKLIRAVDATILTIVITAASAAILWFNSKDKISAVMTFLVGLMGIAFAALALSQKIDLGELAVSTVVPRMPAGSELVVLGLVGTTIVPYNIFLGAGISKGQTIPLMRLGLSVSVALGGLITAAILIAGVSLDKFTSFEEVATAMHSTVGSWGAYALGIGLFAAGFSSAITSPYAASLIATSVLGIKSEGKVRLVWGGVLLTGFLFGVSGVKPIPVIIAVQAINGLILPLITLYLIITINDRNLIPAEYRHGTFFNILLLGILMAVLLIGLSSVDKSVSTTLGLTSTNHTPLVLIASVIILIYPAWKIFQPSK